MSLEQDFCMGPSTYILRWYTFGRDLGPVDFGRSKNFLRRVVKDMSLNYSTETQCLHSIILKDSAVESSDANQEEGKNASSRGRRCRGAKGRTLHSTA